MICKKNYQEAHLIRQGAILYKKDLEVLNEIQTLQASKKHSE